MRIKRVAAQFIAMIWLLSALIAKAETLTATIPLRPANVVPPVSGLDAEGTMTLTIDVTRTSSGEITGGSVNFLLRFKFPGSVTITGFPLREGSATANGPEMINADDSSTTFGSGSGRIDISADVKATELLRLLANPTGFYINVSTSANPGGVLRGQLTTLVETIASTVKMTPGAVINPPTPPPAGATGTATISIHPTRHPGNGMVNKAAVELTVIYNFPGSVTVTGLKIHQGRSGIIGLPIIDTGISTSNPIVSASGKGAINIVLRVPVLSSSGEGPVEPLRNLIADPNNFYVNLETTANPAGALRAQLSAFARPPEKFYAANYVLTGGEATQFLTLMSAGDFRGTDGAAAVLINDISVPFAVGEVPGQILIQVPPASQISLSSLLFVQLQNSSGLLSEPITIVTTRPENINALAAVTVDGARFGQVVAPTSIAAIFGTDLASQAVGASKLPLPTSLDDTTVYVNGRAARLFFVSPLQINLEIPPETPPGRPASVVIVNKNGIVSHGMVTVSPTAVGIFTAKGDGTGAPAGVASANGQNFNILLNNPDGTPAAIDAGNIVVLFATGLRLKSGPVGITIGGVNVTPFFAGDQVVFVGLDQINLRIPTELAGKGNVDLELTVDGKKANTVKFKIK